MGAEGFHGRVRDGIGCLAPRYGHQAGQAPLRVGEEEVSGGRAVGLGAARGRFWRPRTAARRGGGFGGRDQVPRAISTGWLHGLPRFHLRPIDVVVCHGSW